MPISAQHLESMQPSPFLAHFLATQLDTFGADDLNDLDRELVGDGFTLSRLLGGDNPSPTTVGMFTSFKDICRR